MAVYYSFHYDRDFWRVQQVMKMGVIEGQTLLNSQAWEEVKRKGPTAIQNWIADEMKYKSAVAVLVGAKTDTREWVVYEIQKAWDDRRPLLGIRIHGLEGRDGETDVPGGNPFAKVALVGGGTVADHVPLYSPSGIDGKGVYASIKQNLTTWVASGYKRP